MTIDRAAPESTGRRPRWKRGNQMLALLTLPREVPLDPDPRPNLLAAREEPVGIVIRPGPPPIAPAGTPRPRPSLALA